MMKALNLLFVISSCWMLLLLQSGKLYHLGIVLIISERYIFSLLGHAKRTLLLAHLYQAYLISLKLKKPYF